MSSLKRIGRSRWLAVVVLAVSVLAVTAGSSAADPPGTHPIRPMPPITFGCPQGFSVRITTVRFHVYEAIWKLPNGEEVTYDDGPDVQRITDLRTGASLVESLAGPAVGIVHPDHVLQLLTAGRSIVLFTRAQADSLGRPSLAGVSLITGRTNATFSAAGQPTSFSYTGRATSVCGILSHR